MRNSNFVGRGSAKADAITMVCGGDAAFCQITFDTCLTIYAAASANLRVFISYFFLESI